MARDTTLDLHDLCFAIDTSVEEPTVINIANRLRVAGKTVERRVKKLKGLGIGIVITREYNEGTSTLKLEESLENILVGIDRALGIRPFAMPSQLSLDEQDDVLELYDAILKRKVKKFPYCYFSDRDLSIERLRVMFPYSIGDTWEGSVTLCNPYKIRKEKLSGLFQTHFNDSVYPFLKEIFTFLQPWELKRKPRGYFQGRKGKKHGRAATRWLVEEILEYSEKMLPEMICKNDFIENNLGGMLTLLYSNSPSNAIMSAYPGKYKEFEFSQKSTKWMGRKGKANAREAIRWLIERKLRWSLDSVPKRITRMHFKANGLGGLIQTKYLEFNNSTRKAVMFAYPGRYQKEDFKYYSESRNPL